jgi:indolepyruvate decarboxylase
MKNVPTLGDHLVSRLAEIGIDHLFGVPGDYNLVFLDSVIAHPTLRWVGTANELNAAYAADGYARVNGAAALLTTFGVGELSAINGVAGSYAEYLPVLHIVGAPSLVAQRKGLKMHHTLADGDFSHFARMSAEVSVATAELTVENAVDEIDRVLRTMLYQRRPGYLVLPADVASAPLPFAPKPLHVEQPVCDTAQLAAFSKHVARHLNEATTKVVLADFLASRWDCAHNVTELTQLGRLPSATMMTGKSTLDETLPGFLGTYSGAASEPHVREAVESADALIAVGTLFFDISTAGFSHKIDPSRVIDIQPFGASVAGTHYPDVPMRQALDCVIDEFRRTTSHDAPLLPVATANSNSTDPDAPLTQGNLWPVIQAFLRAGDLVVAEQGTSFYGAAPLLLPKNARFIGQPLWASIGYTIPAAFGAQMAAPDRRTLLLVGDGSALLTAQEIGSMLRNDTRPIIVLLNNDGYTVERAIHGSEQRYNNISAWNWQQVAGAMGRDKPSTSLHATTVGALTSALQQADRADELTLIEAVLPRLDVPPLLSAIAEALSGERKPSADQSAEVPQTCDEPA